MPRIGQRLALTKRTSAHRAHADCEVLVGPLVVEQPTSRPRVDNLDEDIASVLNKMITRGVPRVPIVSRDREYKPIGIATHADIAIALLHFRHN